MVRHALLYIILEIVVVVIMARALELPASSLPQHQPFTVDADRLTDGISSTNPSTHTSPSFPLYTGPVTGQA